MSWTGDGFREVKHGTSLEYAVTNVPYTGEYNVLVRYEAKVHSKTYFVRYVFYCNRYKQFNDLPFEVKLVSSLLIFKSKLGEMFI